MHVHERVKAGNGTTDRKDVHLDRMAHDSCNCMNGDPNKPEVIHGTPANYPRSASAPTYSRVAPHLGQRPSITH